ncbi:MAG: hypothetical protein K0U52_09455 [Gammaproteobacteria bacterium]|nr:hypothetical protein [Gammaproteobacteria bacterium]
MLCIILILLADLHLSPDHSDDDYSLQNIVDDDSTSMMPPASSQNFSDSSLSPSIISQQPSINSSLSNMSLSPSSMISPLSLQHHFDSSLYPDPSIPGNDSLSQMLFSSQSFNSGLNMSTSSSAAVRAVPLNSSLLAQPSTREANYFEQKYTSLHQLKQERVGML